MKKVISIVLAASMAASLAACGSSSATSGSSAASSDSATATSTASSETASASGDAVTINVWSNNRHDEDYMTKMVDAFNSSHTDVQINYTITTDDWANSIQLAYQANTAPDIITMSASDSMDLTTYVSSGMFAPLTDYIAADSTFQTVTDCYNHMYEGLNSIGDDIYWVPNGVRSGTRIEYNPDLLKAAGYTSVPTTLSDFVTAADAVTKLGNGSTYGVGFTSSSPFSRWLEGVGELSGYNHSGYDYTTGKYDFSQWKDLLETAAKFYSDGSVLPGSETQGVDASRALFAQGSFAFWGNAS